jgi:hypothetical protein
VIHYSQWCSQIDSSAGPYMVRVLVADPAKLAIGTMHVAAVIPAHFASEAQAARILARLGKKAAASYLLGKLASTKTVRSGDLGEVLATEYIDEMTSFHTPIRRLRWKDHRNMAMRGDDVIAIETDAHTGTLRFLKAEAKSRVKLSASVVDAARTALDRDGGLPSAHALSFISARLFEAGETEMADAIDDAQLKRGIAPLDVEHMTFTVSENDPTTHLTASLVGYTGSLQQSGVGIVVSGHVSFVRAVFETVKANAINP